MTRKAQSKAGNAPRASARRWPSWGPWAVLGVSVVALGLLASLGWGRLSAALRGLVAPKAREPIKLTILHSNDTWGFVRPCG